MYQNTFYIRQINYETKTEPNMNTFLILSIIPLVLIAMYLVQKKSKSLHLLLVGVAVALLYVNHFYQHEGNQDYLVLLLSLTLFGKLLKNFRQA